MPDSPMAASPYEILGVRADASDDELRRAYRRLLRQTHPDTGGSAARFMAVQQAWDRVGTAEGRAAYDRGHRGAQSMPQQSWAPHAAAAQRDTRPRARSYGHPGGWRRERYLGLIREWSGRSASLEDPYDPALVRSAPREIRHLLADALAEEATARQLAELGIGFTVWHDVVAVPGNPEEKIDHVVLGPTGLYAILSEDYGGPVNVRRGELAGEVVEGRRPLHELAGRAKAFTRTTRVRFTTLVIVLPDDALDDPVTVLGSVRGAIQVVVQHSSLPMLLRDGLSGSGLIGGTDLFDARTRLQAGIRFV